MDLPLPALHRASWTVDPLHPAVSYETKRLRRRIQVNASDESLRRRSMVSSHEGQSTNNITSANHHPQVDRLSSESYTSYHESSSSSECDLAITTLQIENSIFAMTMLDRGGFPLEQPVLDHQPIAPEIPRYFMSEGFPKQDDPSIQMVYSTRPSYVEQPWKQACERFTIPPSMPDEILLSETPEYVARFPQLSDEEEFDAHMWFERWYPDVLREIAAKGKYPAHDEPKGLDTEYEDHPYYTLKRTNKKQGGHIRTVGKRSAGRRNTQVPPGISTPRPMDKDSSSEAHHSPRSTVSTEVDMQYSIELLSPGGPESPKFPTTVHPFEQELDYQFTSRWSSSEHSSPSTPSPRISAKAVKLMGEPEEEIYGSSSNSEPLDTDRRVSEPGSEKETDFGDLQSRFSSDEDSEEGSKKELRKSQETATGLSERRVKMKYLINKVVKGIKRAKTPPSTPNVEEVLDSRWLRRKGYTGDV